MAQSLVNLINSLVFEIAVFRGLPDDAVLGRPIGWLIPQYERVSRAQWDEVLRQTTATEWGVSRALAGAFGSGELPPLKSYEDMLAQNKPAQARLPAWHAKFEEVNRDKRVE